MSATTERDLKAQAKPTEGEWVYFEPSDQIIVEGGQALADLRGTGDNYDYIANGRVMAAGKDLLKAAQESVDSLNEVAEEFGHHNVIMDAISRLQAAIAKATGQE